MGSRSGTLDDLKTYWHEAKKSRRAYPGRLSVVELVRDFPLWLWCRKSGGTPLTDARPWITFPAIRFLEQTLCKDMRVFEYGAGGSTLFFAERVREVVSIEHDPLWAAKVTEAIRQREWDHCRVKCVEPSDAPDFAGKDPANPDDYVSTSRDHARKSFRAYATSIDDYPDGYFDLIQVDGRARPSCFTHSLVKVKPGGHIVWDNTDRDHYQRAMAAVPAHFQFIDFPGPTPYLPGFTRTSAWKVLPVNP